jgi:hypothetical protein
MSNYAPVKRARAHVLESNSVLLLPTTTLFDMPNNNNNNSSSNITLSFTTYPPPRLCQRCKQQYDPRNQTFCIFHPEYYCGETMEQQLGIGTSIVPSQGIVYSWACCGAPYMDSPGCSRGHHIPYDEKMPVVNSGNMNNTTSMLAQSNTTNAMYFGGNYSR